MSSLGENLRREREMRGVSLEEISAATRISVRFLQAIEGEELSKLPGGIFTRSFIRAYAKYLGLDEEHVLAEFQISAKTVEEVSFKRFDLSKPAPQAGSSRTLFLTLLVAVTLLAGGYVIFQRSRRAVEMPGAMSNPGRVSAAPASTSNPSQSGTSGVTTPPPNPTTPASASDAGAGQTNQAITGAQTASHPQSGLSPGSAKGVDAKDGLVLQVAATERVWVGVEADGKTALQRVLNPNEVETLKARESFDVTVGNARGIVLTLNGETLKPLGGRGEVKSVHLTYDDLKNSNP